MCSCLCSCSCCDRVFVLFVSILAFGIVIVFAPVVCCVGSPYGSEALRFSCCVGPYLVRSLDLLADERGPE